MSSLFNCIVSKAPLLLISLRLRLNMLARCLICTKCVGLFVLLSIRVHCATIRLEVLHRRLSKLCLLLLLRVRGGILVALVLLLTNTASLKSFILDLA